MYIVRHAHPSLNTRVSDLLFDPYLDTVQHAALAAFVLVSRALLRQPTTDSDWPALSARHYTALKKPARPSSR